MTDAATPPPSDAAPCPTAVSTARLVQVPRLSIRFLLIWTAVTAALLQVARSYGWFDSRIIWGPPLMALFAAAAGMLIFGSLLIGWHTVRRTRWPLEPGEWLVLVLTNLLLAWIAISIVTHWRYVDFAGKSTQNYYGYQYSLNYTKFWGIHLLPTALGVALMLRALAWRRQPLACLLHVLAGVCLLWLGLNIVAFVLPFQTDPSYGNGPFVEIAIPGQVVAVFLLAAIAQRRRGLWLAVLIILALGALSSNWLIQNSWRYGGWSRFLFLSRAEQLTVVSTYVIILTAFGLLATAMIDDWRRREPRHWLHWSGVLSSILLLVGLLTTLTLALLIEV